MLMERDLGIECKGGDCSAQDSHARLCALPVLLGSVPGAKPHSIHRLYSAK